MYWYVVLHVCPRSWSCTKRVSLLNSFIQVWIGPILFPKPGTGCLRFTVELRTDNKLKKVNFLRWIYFPSFSNLMIDLFYHDKAEDNNSHIYDFRSVNLCYLAETQKNAQRTDLLSTWNGSGKIIPSKQRKNNGNTNFSIMLGS